MNLEEILAQTADGLRAKLTQLNLSTIGLKVTLQDRLIEHFGLSRAIAEEDEEQLEEAETSASVPADRAMFTLRDIEDSMTQFDGTSYTNINLWIREFEETAITVNWNDLQKYVYAKQLLKGAAKLFLRSQTGIKNWDGLKMALINEFGTQLSSAEVHRLLKARRKKPTETLREYLYCLVELGEMIALDDESVIEYFVEGIPDARLNKMVLYQAKSLSELKSQLKVYEKVRGPNPQSSYSGGGQRPSSIQQIPKQEKTDRKCFKCGQTTHIARELGS